MGLGKAALNGASYAAFWRGANKGEIFNGTGLGKTGSTRRLSSMICYKWYLGGYVKDFLDSFGEVFVRSGV